MSSTGAKFRFTPRQRSARAVTAPSSTMPLKPLRRAREAGEGRFRPRAAVRTTRPPSWSMAMTGWWRQSFRSVSVSLRTCSTEATFRENRTKPAGCKRRMAASSSAPTSWPLMPIRAGSMNGKKIICPGGTSGCTGYTREYRVPQSPGGRLPHGPAAPEQRQPCPPPPQWRQSPSGWNRPW